MIFSELYGGYYNAVASILRIAVERPVTKADIRAAAARLAFSESGNVIESALLSGKWQLLRPDGTTPLRRAPTMPLTTLQKRWLKAISLDPRVRLFELDFSGLSDVAPLFTPEDICIFDKYADGDPYEDEKYISIFRAVLDAVRHNRALSLTVKNRAGSHVKLNVRPEYLEYSEKDDKFRLFTSGCRYGRVVNLARIKSCKPYAGELRDAPPGDADEKKTVILQLYNSRNCLERALLHFADFEKEARRVDGELYQIKLTYLKSDETEAVIRVLSFGPFIKVTEPESFVELIKKRLQMQKKL